jgi:hypothetical protein
MKALVVKDLSMTEEMEPKAMARVRGGILYGFDPSRHDPDPGFSPGSPRPRPSWYSPLPLPIELPKFLHFPIGVDPPVVTLQLA